MSDETSQESSSRPDRFALQQRRPLQIGDEVPNFTCDSHMGMITLHSFIDGGWGVILV